MLTAIKRVLLGEPLRNEQLQDQKLPVWKALPMLSPDALSSIAYGPQELIRQLTLVYGISAIGFSLPITLAIIGLLSLLILSFRQIVFQYPKGGGAYKVSYDNLGRPFGLVSGASLLVDYTLTVAVSVSAAKDFILPFFPSSYEQYGVFIALFFISIIMFLNLRGLRESGNVLAIPTYLFIFGIMLLVGKGLFDIIVQGGLPSSLPTTHLSGNISWFVLLRAFSTGCASLTGVDAIANAVPYFKKPEMKNCARALITLGALLGLSVAGVVFLAYAYQIAPPTGTGETLLAPLIAAIFGQDSFLYFYILGITAVILIFAANTGFAGFPLLAAIMAKDGFMPRLFTNRGDRLSFSNGIILLAIASGTFVVIFKADVENLMPLYTVGVFLSFMLAQSAMVVRWLKFKEPNWIRKMSINALGAVVSLAVFFITLYTKFIDGAWIVMLLLTILIFVFNQISKHYDSIAKQLRLDFAMDKPIEKNNLTIIPISGVSRVVCNTLSYAKSMKGDTIAFYVGFDHEVIDKMTCRWTEWAIDIPLKTVYSKYRSLVRPLLDFINETQTKGDHEHITILIPEFILAKWWHRLLHNQTALILRIILLSRKNITISTVPFHLTE